MSEPAVQYEYVNLENQFMRLAYKLAKNLYMVKKWNLKTTPVAVLVKNGEYINHGVCADGAHAINGHCDRLGEAGTSYGNCKHCAEEEHAERKALQAAYDKDLQGSEVYVYGHYKMCDHCIAALKARGVTRFVLLENASTLFDRHHPQTVLGTENQFLI